MSNVPRCVSFTLTYFLILQPFLLTASPIFSDSVDKPTPFRYTFRVERIEFGDANEDEEDYIIPDCEDVDYSFEDYSDEEPSDEEDTSYEENEDEEYPVEEEDEEYPTDDEEDYPTYYEEEYPTDDEEEYPTDDEEEYPIDDEVAEEEYPINNEQEEENPDEPNSYPNDEDEEINAEDISTDQFTEDNEIDSYNEEVDDFDLDDQLQEYVDDSDEYYQQEEEDISSFPEVISVPSVRRRHAHRHPTRHGQKDSLGSIKIPFPTWMPAVRHVLARPDRNRINQQHHQRHNPRQHIAF